MAPKKQLLLGTRKGLVIYHQQADGSWLYQRTEFVGIPVTIATIDPNTGMWWALQDHGHWGCKVHRSPDGKVWEEIEAPKYPEGEEAKEGVAAATKYLWAFANGSSNQNSKIYIGTEPGGLFISDDNGDSFSLNRGLWDQPTRKTQWFGGGRDNAGIHSILVDPRDENHLYIGISCAGVYESIDGGQTWQVRNKGLKADFLPDPDSEVGQDPHLVVMSPSNPDVLWQQNHCGIFMTRDGGQLWHDVTDNNGPANFGFAVAVDEQNPEVAWVVPGVSDMVRVAVDEALCVCRTDDGGSSWQTFTSGLPQTGVFDITYRHGLDITGDTLAFGTTTGNLYLSENRGEHWQTISNNLPMIHSVEFV
ncbi:MAG: glycosyl hydrolase [Bacteroidota bacterium]